MSVLTDLKNLKPLQDRVVSKVAQLRTQTASWPAVSNEMKRCHSQILDKTLWSEIETYSSEEFQAIIQNDSPPSLEAICSLPNALELSPEQMRQHHVVYLAAIVNQDDEVSFDLYSGSGAAFENGSYGRLIVYKKIITRLLDYDTALIEFIESLDDDSGLDTEVLDELPSLSQMAVHMQDALRNGGRIKHIGIAFMIKREGRQDITAELFRAWALILECWTMHTTWSVWKGSTSKDHDELLLRHMCPWDVKKLGYGGLNGQIPLMERVGTTDGKTRYERNREMYKLVKELLKKGEITEDDPRVTWLRSYTARWTRMNAKVKEARAKLNSGQIDASSEEGQMILQYKEQAAEYRRKDRAKNTALRDAFKAGIAQESDPGVLKAPKLAEKSSLSGKRKWAAFADLWKSGRDRLERGDPTATEEDPEVIAFRKYRAKSETNDAKRKAKRQQKLAEGSKEHGQARDEVESDSGVLAPLPNPPAAPRRSKRGKKNDV